MIDFYKVRLAKHQKRMFKYLKYVMNDHFILICMVGLGGFGYYYSEYLKNLTPAVSWVPIVVGLVWFISLFVGRLSTLMQEADAVFLIPKERAMTTYLKRGLNYSTIFPTIAISLIVGVTFPLVAITKSVDFSMTLFIIASLLALKYADLWIQLESLYLDSGQNVTTHRIIWTLGAIGSLFCSLYVSFYVGVAVAFVISIVLVMLSKKTLESSQLNWEKSIQVERKRMKRLYSFFNLFTDVPGLSSDVRRRKYLDGLLNRIKKTSENTYLYLYARVVARGSEYSSLTIRLILVGMVLLFFTKSFWLMAILGSLFIYLLGFQLIPIYHAFDYMLMTQLYPISYKLKHNAVLFIIRSVIGIMTLIFSLVVVVALPNKLDGIKLALVFVMVFVLLSWSYLPMKLKKMEKMENR
ncbi:MULTISPECIES: ABC transporter permease [Vagococcus]|uniref:ABC transporter permease n=1 Tax=Vagococcus TaxID=2737 RepID=UPI000E54775F|nr:MULTISPECIES: ABC transporter permease [Vagococcus]RHH69935.1 multidrug ABC transporter permease [Vagococcus sp. AM17-17]